MEFSKFSLKLVRESDIDYNPVRSPEELQSFFKSLGSEPEEIFAIICLDAKNKPIAYFEVSRGTLSASLVHPREVFKRALACNAYSIALAHNHPSGDLKASQEDINTTKQLIQAGGILGIPVVDHLIIVDGGYRSIREECSYLWN